MAHMLSQIGVGRHGLDRAGVAARCLTGGMRDAAEMLHHHWYAANQLSCDLGLPDDVGDALRYTFERWDGKGPGKRKADDIPLVGRIVNLADVIEVFHRASGADAAAEVARVRSGTQFDPHLVTVVSDHRAALFADLDDATWKLSDAALGELVAQDLARAGLPLPAAPSAVYTRRLRQAYPIYLNGYEVPFGVLDRWAEGLPRLLSYGRQGLFAHDNTHHAIAMAYDAVGALAGDVRRDDLAWRTARERFRGHIVED